MLGLTLEHAILSMEHESWSWVIREQQVRGNYLRLKSYVRTCMEYSIAWTLVGEVAGETCWNACWRGRWQDLLERLSGRSLARPAGTLVWEVIGETCWNSCLRGRWRDLLELLSERSLARPAGTLVWEVVGETCWNSSRRGSCPRPYQLSRITNAALMDDWGHIYSILRKISQELSIVYYLLCLFCLMILVKLEYGAGSL